MKIFAFQSIIFLLSHSIQWFDNPKHQLLEADYRMKIEHNPMHMYDLQNKF